MKSPALSNVIRNSNFRSKTWICLKCHAQTRRQSSSVDLAPAKPYYVTTPIFYVNAAPHIGHLYSLILADILKRWRVLQGQKAILCTGTDEHGMKIQRAAEKAKINVRALCDENAQAFDDLAQKAHIDRDHFIRTSEPEHRFAVQHFWLMLKDRGYIYPSKHEGWYSISDETFYPKSAVQLALDPSTGRKFMASSETGKEVEWTSENNYHFRMSAFKDRLLEFYSQNPSFILPSTRMKEVVNQVQSGLEDLSISRPVERLNWGIPVPDDDTQTIYVWLDALINYLTKANYPFQIPGQENAAGWPADCHVIGKDIVRFHCIYWPAFLMALDLPLPRQILTHAHWTLGRAKMSKSTGNVVNPFFALERFGVDTMRFFLALRGSVHDDASYDNSFIIKVYQHHLQSTLGNLLTRIVRGRGWSVRRAVQSRPGLHEGEAIDHRGRLKDLPLIVAKHMDALDSRAALEAIMEVLRKTNAFMQISAPWTMHQPRDILRLDGTIYLCAESVRICGILLLPYMPSAMTRLLDMLGVAPEQRTYGHTLAPGTGYGGEGLGDGGAVGGDGSAKGITGVVFPPLRSEF